MLKLMLMHVMLNFLLMQLISVKAGVMQVTYFALPASLLNKTQDTSGDVGTRDACMYLNYCVFQNSSVAYKYLIIAFCFFQ